MPFKAFWVAYIVLVLTACAAHPVAKAPVPELWMDAAFEHEPAKVAANLESLFRLDEALVATLRLERLQRVTVHDRVDYLLESILGPQGKTFFYLGGNSSVASETWKTRRGDCLSLTVLAYAMAQELGLHASMQEVAVPITINRRGGIDYNIGHVNLFIPADPNTYWERSGKYNNGSVIDFEPVVGSVRLGQALTPSEMLARFYNNLGAQGLADTNRNMAYAYFRAAIKADPAFVPAYSNLAFLYRQGGYAIQAERVLRYAMTLNEKSDLALRSLHAMLVMQGRSDEAAIYAKDIQARQEQDPYYWIGVGLDHFKQARYQAAIVALERAQSLTSGFVEVHRALAVAYFKQGAKIKVQEQVAALASIDDADPSLSALNQKLRSLH